MPDALGHAGVAGAARGRRGRRRRRARDRARLRAACCRTVRSRRRTAACCSRACSRAYAPRGPVLFDEYHLGVGERRSMMRYLRQAGAMPFIVQLVFVALLLLWRAARASAACAPPEAAPGRARRRSCGARRAVRARARSARARAQLLVKQALARIAAPPPPAARCRRASSPPSSPRADAPMPPPPCGTRQLDGAAGRDLRCPEPRARRGSWSARCR